ncbi:MAG TPA: hypothetical protein V6D17_22515 [Candidatus Obscuribacterales bacterium]
MVEPQQIAATSTYHKRRRLHFGPGTVAMMVALVIAGAWRLMQPPKVVIERRVERSGEAAFERRPSVDDLMHWSQALTLSSEQLSALKKLQEEEKLQLQPVEEEIERAVRAFNEIAGRGEGKSAGLAELQAAAQPIANPSRRKRQIEQRFAEQGMSLLDATQRAGALLMWQEKLQRMRGLEKEQTIRERR